MSICFGAPAMVLWLASQLDDGATPEQAERLFDLLVLRGRLTPLEHGLWRLDRISATELERLASL
jgi:hypothetical protein